jgi:hypothetical protein
MRRATRRLTLQRATVIIGAAGRRDDLGPYWRGPREQRVTDSLR